MNSQKIDVYFIRPFTFVALTAFYKVSNTVQERVLLRRYHRGINNDYPFSMNTGVLQNSSTKFKEVYFS